MIVSQHNTVTSVRRRWLAQTADDVPVRQAGDRNVGNIKAAILAASKEAREALELADIEDALAGGIETQVQYVMGFGLAVFEMHLQNQLRPALRKAYKDGANAALKQAKGLGGFPVARAQDQGPIAAAAPGQVVRATLRAVSEGRIERAAKGPIEGMSFDLNNPEAVAFIDKHGAETIAGITNASRQAIRDVIRTAFISGIPIREAARMLRDVITLSPAQAEAVLNLRQKILEKPGNLIRTDGGRVRIRVPAGGASPEFVARATDRYAQRLLNHRALGIARTESIRASNMGQMQLWRQAEKEGLLTGREWKTWIVSPDERLCPLCEVLDGERVPYDQPFSDGNLVPPDHALCRCATGLVEAPAGWVRPGTEGLAPRDGQVEFIV